MLKNLYLFFAVIGTIIPWFFFSQFFATSGLDIPLFLRSLFINGAAGGFSADILISIIVFLIWAYTDAQKLKIQRWWWILPATFTVGLSLALPLYLYLRED